MDIMALRCLVHVKWPAAAQDCSGEVALQGWLHTHKTHALALSEENRALPYNLIEYRIIPESTHTKYDKGGIQS